MGEQEDASLCASQFVYVCVETWECHKQAEPILYFYAMPADDTTVSISPASLQPLILRSCAPTHSTNSPLSSFCLVLIPHRLTTCCGVVWCVCGVVVICCLLRLCCSTTEREDGVACASRCLSAGGPIRTGAGDRCNGPLRWVHKGILAANRDAGLLPRLVQLCTSVLCCILLCVGTASF